MHALTPLLAVLLWAAPVPADAITNAADRPGDIADDVLDALHEKDTKSWPSETSPILGWLRKIPAHVEMGV